MKIELDIIISKVDKARKAHICDYCGKQIAIGSHYTKLTVRRKGERFPHDKRVCKDHKMGLIPLGVLLNEKI